MSRRDARPFWSASAERQALKARRGETRTGLDAQLATRAEHAIAVSGPRPEMPLASKRGIREIQEATGSSSLRTMIG
jgi:hypothetical protein